MPADRDARIVLLRYALRGDAVPRAEALAGAGGFSGSRLWRVTADRRVLCLRCWPMEHPTVERLTFIHRVLAHVAAKLPIVAAPLSTAAGATFVSRAGHLWELTPWMPGAADSVEQPKRTRLVAAMRVLARFHQLAAEVDRRRGVPPSVVERQEFRERLMRGGLSEIEAALRRPLSPDLDQLAARLFGLARWVLLAPRLAAFALSTPICGLQPAIRDIHREHVLFTGDEVTGLIDFGALRIDTPLTDVARLVGSLAGDDADARSAALGAYAELLPLTVDQRRLIDWLDESGIVFGALNWLLWLYVERRDMGPAAPIAARLNMLHKRLARRFPEGRVDV